MQQGDEYESARASVNNSHYTEVHVIEAMWQAIEGFGFIATNPAWIEARLARNPQWINEQLKRMSQDGDLFA